MHYVSTRGAAPVRDFAGVLLAGLAEDGGLYVPEAWPAFTPADWRALRGLPYHALAARVMQPFVGEAIPSTTLAALCREAYAGFDHPAVVPLVQLETNLFVQELFHGPTLSFKDMALQLIGRLFDHVLAERDARVTIVGATSGDTGSAAIEACAGRERVDIAFLHPHHRTSEVQRRQMTTVTAPNVANIAIEGTFDDCQDLVKAMFGDTPFRQEMHLSAMNSINWARIAAQVPYYVASSLALGAPDREVAFSVPTGNFGNVLAAWVARRMGLPIARLTVGSNRNDILARFLASNDMSITGVEPSLSPSMDIQVSSNFERLLFELLERDAKTTAATMTAFRSSGRMAVPEAQWHRCRTLFHGFRLDDARTEAEIVRVHRATGYLADPHTAIGIAAARANPVHGVPV
ncbi:MAG TPA: threonine synthase, partial [Acetobacteraceae bacterium]|nr:threonine synthase [Acetobacteraceae bacterium]